MKQLCEVRPQNTACRTLLTPWSVEKMIDRSSARQKDSCYGNRRFSVAFRRAWHLSVPEPEESTQCPSILFSLRHIFYLFSSTSGSCKFSLSLRFLTVTVLFHVSHISCPSYPFDLNTKHPLNDAAYSTPKPKCLYIIRRELTSSLCRMCVSMYVCINAEKNIWMQQR